jgi:hypothetical protein
MTVPISAAASTSQASTTWKMPPVVQESVYEGQLPLLSSASSG